MPPTQPTAATPRPAPGAAPALAARYAEVRAQTLALAAPLSEADAQVQPMPDASPTKWHLAHVTWFFETFLLERFEADFTPFHPAYRVLFNSYYNGIGNQHPRAQRGHISRPTLAEIKAYRAAVDARMTRLIEAMPAGDAGAKLAELVELGLQHEQQHQELILTDLLYLLSCNPLAPAYQTPAAPRRAVSLAPVSTHASASAWAEFDGGLVEIGHAAGSGFAFDNEGPRHRSHLRPYALARQPVSQGDWAEFIAEGAYREPRWWLSAGWDWVRTNAIQAPLHWRAQDNGSWLQFTLNGLLPLDAQAPVAHISYFEADAYARWRAAQTGSSALLRLPTEAEWEHAAQSLGAAGQARAIAAGNFVDNQALRALPPSPAAQDVSAEAPLQLFGDVWEWTNSSYAAYPGFRAWDGAVGEYNAKFMVNQYVLRGGSCATPRSHIRASYRNFFPTDTRWQFTGLRLARDLD
ncbi:MAG: ergothioneine biosynthesis protein EgtB [Leptothrix sp. (in: b-proteobacteria)]